MKIKFFNKIVRTMAFCLIFTLFFGVILTSAAVPRKAYASVEVESVYAKSTSVEEANAYDYTKTMSSLGAEPYTFDELRTIYKPYGTLSNEFYGMPEAEYLDAINNPWVDVTHYEYDPEPINFSLETQYTYDELMSKCMLLSRHDGVYMYNIGTSTDGRPMYAIEIDMTTRNAHVSTATHTILLTGQVHARETAGPSYIIKQMIDIVNACEAGDPETVNLLDQVRYVAVPCVNPDGHDGIGFDTKNWKYSDGQLWKATSNGSDLNRNFPGLSWMQLKKGVKQTSYKATTADKLYYWGDYAGSCNETKAMMKFYQYWVGVKKAEILVDYHQQGRVSYAGKGYATDYMNKNSENLRKAVYATQKEGPLGRSYSRVSSSEEDTAPDYGLYGSGSTNTDYAWAVALGAKYSSRYGFSVYTSKDGKTEYPLIMVPCRDKSKVGDLELSKVLNSKFRSFSWEIGSGSSYLGYSKDTLKLLAKEYDNYNFKRMLYTYAYQLIDTEY